MTDPLKKSLLKLTARQRTKAMAELEQPGIEKTFAPMSAADRALWNKAKRKRGRP